MASISEEQKTVIKDDKVPGDSMETKCQQPEGSQSQQQGGLKKSLPDGEGEQQARVEKGLSGLTKNQLRKLKKRQMWEKKKEQRV